MPPKPAIIGTREACRILDLDRSTVIRYALAGRIELVQRMPGTGTYLLDRASVEKLAAELAKHTNGKTAK